MDNIMQYIPPMVSAVLLAALILTVVTNIITQVLKKFTWEKILINILAFLVVMAVTLLALFAACQIMVWVIAWYMVAEAVAPGLFIAYAVMFGHDKLREALEQIINWEKRKTEQRCPPAITLTGAVAGGSFIIHATVKITIAERGNIGYHKGIKCDKTRQAERNWETGNRPPGCTGGGITAQTKGCIFKYLTKNNRLRMERWLNKGMKLREITDKLRVHISTVYRELKWGEHERLDGDAWEMVMAYSPDITEERYQNHLREKGPDLKTGADHELARYTEETIATNGCSPVAVLGYAKMEGWTLKTSVSVAITYSYIREGIFLRITQVDLPRRGKKKQGYKKVKTRKDQVRAPVGESIECRSKRTKNREEFGHWEMDTMYDRKDSTNKALLVLTERKTRWEIIILIPNHKAETIVKALDALERKTGIVNFGKIFRTVTVDSGSEFSVAEGMERSVVNKTIPRTKVYFCHPYSPWERGSNENANIMTRREHPKGTDFGRVSARQIAETE